MIGRLVYRFVRDLHPAISFPAALALAAGFPFLVRALPYSTALDAGARHVAAITQPLLMVLAAGIAGFLLVATLHGTIAWLSRRTLIFRYTKLNRLRNLSWSDWERLVQAYYERLGYKTSRVGGDGADGGIDVEARKNGKLTIIQCKHWRAPVGVNIVRELYGVMHHRKADRCAVFTTGRFSREAFAFIQGKPIDLYNGKRLLAALKETATVKRTPAPLGPGAEIARRP